MIVGVIVVLLLLTAFGVAMMSAYKAMSILKTLRDIYYYQVFNLTNQSDTREIPQMSISFRRIYTRLIPYSGVCLYRSTQFDVHPAVHAMLWMVLWSAMFFAALTAELDELDLVHIFVCSIIISASCLLLQGVVAGQFLAAFNIRSGISEPNLTTVVKMGQDDTTEILGVVTEQPRDEQLPRQSQSISADDTQAAILTTEAITSTVHPRTIRPAPKGCFEYLCLSLLLLNSFFLCASAAIVSNLGAVEVGVVVSGFVIGLAVDLVIRLVVGLVGRKCFVDYSTIYEI